MALPNNTTHISDFSTTNEVTPEDYVPVVRNDQGSFGNYKTKARNFISYPFGYLNGGAVTWTGSSCTVGATYCRDSTGAANIMVTSPITKTVNASIFYPSGYPGSSGTYYVVVARKSESDTSSTFFLTSQNGGALGSDWAYSRAVATGYYNSSTHQLTNIRCFDTQIISIQETDVTVGSALANGQIILVIDPL